jgi:PTS system nitrogen regulatory IIA component
MYLKSILSLDCTQCAVQFNSKKRILQYISQLAHKKYPELPGQDIVESLLVREKLGSTGIGHGIALPHGRLRGVTKSVAIFLVTEKPIDYDAIDKKSVDIFCALLIPEENSQDHLSTLSQIAKMLSDKPLVKKMRHCKSNEELYSLIMANAL